jgi:hypothetical protein
MNPGVSEEAGKTARGFIEAMKDQPALLAMIFVNAVMLIFMFYLLHSNQKTWENQNQYRYDVGKEVLRYVTETSRLLAQCSVIPPEQVPQPPKI